MVCIFYKCWITSSCKQKLLHICKVANRNELLKRWDYLIEIHPNNNKWVEFKENALKHYDEKSTISYLGFLNDEIICEITAYIKDSALYEENNNQKVLVTDKDNRSRYWNKFS